VGLHCKTGATPKQLRQAEMTQNMLSTAHDEAAGHAARKSMFLACHWRRASRPRPLHAARLQRE